MPQIREHLEIELTPIPPDTVDSLREELMPLIKETLLEAEKEELLSPEHIDVQVERTFPAAEVIVVGFTFLSGIALETYKALILPRLKKRFGVKTRSKARKNTGS